jgi:hypothetical protein
MKLKKVSKASIIVPILASVAAGGFLVSSLYAEAAVTPTVTTVIQNGSNNNISNALVGTMVHANVLVASSTATTSPIGTVDFSLFGNTSCTGSAVTQTGVVLVNGSANSASTTLTATGLSFRAHYNGQIDKYTTADSNCVTLTANQQVPSVTNSLSSTNITVGSSVFDSAVLNGAFANASGTVTYRVFTNNSCTANLQNAGVRTVTNSVVPNSDSIQFNTPGTYYWQAVYSGDLNNVAATSSCGSAVLTVNATTTPPVNTPGTISGVVFNDKNGNDKKDSTDTGLSGWTVWLHKSATSTSWVGKLWNKHDGYTDPVAAKAVTDANGNYSFGNLVAGNYYVEEKVESGWTQTTDDMKVVITDSNNSGKVVDFANIQKNSEGNHNGKGHGHHGNKGHHYGWNAFGNWGKKGDK